MADDEEISVFVGKGRRFHQVRGPWSNWLRCGGRMTFMGPQSAGNAIRAGLTPCAKCFPIHPIETWDVAEGSE
jgi:hypothetical protein